MLKFDSDFLKSEPKLREPKAVRLVPGHHCTDAGAHGHRRLHHCDLDAEPDHESKNNFDNFIE